MRNRTPPPRPSDEELRHALGSAAIERHPLRDHVERISWSTNQTAPRTAILKSGGFWRTTVERELYRTTLVPAIDGSPTLLVASPLDAQTEWVLIEDVVDGAPVDLDSVESVAQIYRQLAAIHAGHVGLEGSSSRPVATLRENPLSILMPADVERAVARLADLVLRSIEDRDGWEIGATERRTIESLEGWAREGGHRLAASGPITLVHGDFQRSNWLIDPTGARVLDWEMAAIGPGILDLYFLTLSPRGAGHAPAGPAAAAALAAYCDGLAASRAHGPSAADAARLLPDVIAWGALTGAILRLDDYFSDIPRSRTPRDELPAAAASLIASAGRQVDRRRG